ncbi:P-loop NTPase family protein [Paenibacillus durus]|uniref:CobQ/CobB/MinD/ParA nucleotide binding domain-containing protein n=1 Tax=Paenibacillus durus ATCC 35681 TaxID=1333534 RepID=A0A0F7F760_PAEDU|nr:hypothetical protein [Paenibacillus durus]AKG33682.1 hypothetical protein VK70_03025 [Paenibacillus durus ATCC 35681]
MKIFSLGLDQLTINDIRQAGYTVVMQTSLPDPQQTAGHMLIAASGQAGVSELRGLREKYPDTIILYFYMEHGVRGYHGIHLTCEELGVYFLPPRSTSSAIIEKIRLILKEDGDERSNVVGVLGSGPGIGCTSVAGLLAGRIAAAGRRVILLGMNVYDPGYDRKAAISLDRLRPKLTGNRLHDVDFDQLIMQDGYRYLPGNFDYLSAQDYQENEMEYLLDRASDNADIVIADLGSVPESAAWYTGMRKSALRLLVTHAKHEHRLESLMDLAGHMDLTPQDFKLILNRSGLEENVSPKSMALRFGTEIFLNIPYYPQISATLPLGKKDLAQADEKVRGLLSVFGFEPEIKKKGMFL